MQVDQIERFRLLTLEHLSPKQLGTARELGVLLLQRLLLDNVSGLINKQPDPPSTKEDLSGLAYIYCCFWLSIYLSRVPTRKPEPLQRSFPKLADQPAYMAAADILQHWLSWLESGAAMSSHSIGADSGKVLRQQISDLTAEVRDGIEALRSGHDTTIQMMDGQANYHTSAGVWAVGAEFTLPMPLYVNIREERGKPVRPYYNLNKDYWHCMPYAAAGIDANSRSLFEILDST